MVDRLLNAWLTLGTNLWFLPFLMGAALAETMRRAKERTIHRDAAARAIAPTSATAA